MPNILIEHSQKREFFDAVMEWHKLREGGTPIIATMPTEGPPSGEWVQMSGVPDALIAFLKERGFRLVEP
jgi:hypothetical protein